MADKKRRSWINSTTGGAGQRELNREADEAVSKSRQNEAYPGMTRDDLRTARKAEYYHDNGLNARHARSDASDIDELGGTKGYYPRADRDQSRALERARKLYGNMRTGGK